MENIPQFNLPWHMIVVLSFYVLIICYAVFTTIFYYHWNQYSMDRTATIQTFTAYFVISLPLIAIMGLCLFGI
jgi:hypothetical protein